MNKNLRDHHDRHDCHVHSRVHIRVPKMENFIRNCVWRGALLNREKICFSLHSLNNWFIELMLFLNSWYCSGFDNVSFFHQRNNSIWYCEKDWFRSFFFFWNQLTTKRIENMKIKYLHHDHAHVHVHNPAKNIQI